MTTPETITALATPPGYGGIGVIRLSGEKTQAITKAILGKLPQPRQAEYLPFKDQQGTTLDIGIALFFPGPNSFTGEDVLELQGHGGPIILDSLLQHILTLGARLARPGEFSERAFLNDKIDLTQAEAIADLINASSEQAARSAIRSLQGEFSSYINLLLEQLIQLRIYVEAAIDFPEEEINFLNDAHIQEQLTDLINKVGKTLQKAQQGAILKEGIHIVITGKPNAGKSTLLNCLSGREAAIVTDIPGTTRDIMREQINIDGMPLHIIDTAGLRDSTDKIEQEGIRRAWDEIEKADRILLMLDSQEEINLQNEVDFFCKKLPKNLPITIIRNKIDLTQEQSGVTQQNGFDVIALSAKEKQGIDKLLEYLKASVGYQTNTEAEFIARRRHLTALSSAQQSLLTGQQQLQQHQAGELLAEDLRTAQQALAEITGEFTSDDLLGRIFSSFCIGK